MASAAFKYVTPTAATTFALTSLLFLFYGRVVVSFRMFCEDLLVKYTVHIGCFIKEKNIKSFFAEHIHPTN